MSENWQDHNGPVFAGQKLVVVGGSSGMGRQTAADVVAGGGSAVGRGAFRLGEAFPPGGRPAGWPAR